MPPRWCRDTRRRRPGEREGTGSSVSAAAPRRRALLAGAFDQALAQAALPPQSPLDPAHPPVVALVIVTDQVEKAMERQHPDLDRLGVTRLPRLTPRDASGDDDVAQQGS